jgi:hypothetical protein
MLVVHGSHKEHNLRKLSSRIVVPASEALFRQLYQDDAARGGIFGTFFQLH